MKPIHHREREQFRHLFQRELPERLEERYTVLDAFLRTEKHVTASELRDQVAEAGKDLDLDFVRETLKLLAHYGFARSNRFDNGHVRYEHRHLGDHHDHMICTRCRRIIEFEDAELEALQQRIAMAQGFHMLQHRMEIYGICRSCIGERQGRIPLSAARQGERLTIKDFSGGSGARLRLNAMGLRIGDALEVITNLNKGQLVICADFKRYVLGRGLAQKIIVQPVRAGGDSPSPQAGANGSGPAGCALRNPETALSEKQQEIESHALK